MKISKYLISMFTLLLFISSAAFAQEKLTREQYTAQWDSLTIVKASLLQQDSVLQADIANLKSKNIQSYDDCIKELYAMVGATQADVDNSRNAVTELDGKISRKEGPKADRQKDLDALKANKISALPEFFDKVHNQMQAALDAWVEAPKEVNYNVVKGDCLWNIAKKPVYYGNGFAWPVIYKANRDQIKNPNLIYPKQIFKIPNLTEEEKAKYDKVKKNYKPAPVK